MLRIHPFPERVEHRQNASLIYTANICLVAIWRSCLFSSLCTDRDSSQRHVCWPLPSRLGPRCVSRDTFCPTSRRIASLQMAPIAEHVLDGGPKCHRVWVQLLSVWKQLQPIRGLFNAQWSVFFHKRKQLWFIFVTRLT
jgi:hypothetical protein